MSHEPQQPAPQPAQASAPAPLGRVLAIACLVPILGVLMLGASRFDAIRAISVGGGVEVTQEQDDQRLYSLARADSALASELQELEPVYVEAGQRQYRLVRIEMMEVTAYCACTICCGKNARGLTASGKPVNYNDGRFVAADTRLLPFGTKLRVPMYHEGAVVEVIDRGGAIKGNKLDVYFDDHQVARRWGRQILPVDILEEVEPEALP
jgi:3D (Asp-Asp-Asp) domain-containing protein